MDGYQEKTHAISVPKNTGIDGFLRTIRGILSLSRVQSINIESTGAVHYTRYVRNGETDDPIGVDYTGLEPWSIIRNGDLEEVTLKPNAPAPSAVAYMFNRITQDSLVPIAFATGAKSEFWAWHERTAGLRLVHKSSAYGLPIYTDKHMPDHSLVLCAAYTRSSLVECHRFLVVNMSEVDFTPPETSVAIL